MLFLIVIVFPEINTCLVGLLVCFLYIYSYFFVHTPLYLLCLLIPFSKYPAMRFCVHPIWNPMLLSPPSSCSDLDCLFSEICDTADILELGIILDLFLSRYLQSVGKSTASTFKMYLESDAFS